MKKILYTLLAGAMALGSCSKSDDAPNAPQSGEQNATFQISAPALTRTPVEGLTRYIVEAYEAGELTATPVREEAATGSLTLALKKETEYTFLFWADKGTASTAIATSGDYYDATSLQDVKVNPAAYAATVAAPAYCAVASFNSKDFEANKAVILKNATAQLNFTEAAGLLTAANTLTVKYSSGGKLNVATGKITEIGSEISRTYANIGQIAKDGILVTDYILAPLDEKRLLDLKMTFNAEAEKSITAVPLQQSYKTNVKGEYSNLYESVFTISNEVGDYENNGEVEFSVKVGDFYYADKTFSPTYTADAQNPCIGIVFVVNPDGTTGKIVGLPEGAGRWGALGVDESLTVTGITSETDGAPATKNLIAARKDETDFATNYFIFNWVYNTINGGDIDGRWYIPATEELTALYAAWNGSSSTTADNAARTAFNEKLTTGSGVAFDAISYWSATQGSSDNCVGVVFDNGGTIWGRKSNSNYRVRCVSAF